MKMSFLLLQMVQPKPWHVFAALKTCKIKTHLRE